MRLRVASVKEEQFKKCIEYKVWGSNQMTMKEWQVGDYLAFKICKEFSALVKISGDSFEDNLMIWDNGFYPYRVPFEIIDLRSVNNRVHHDGKIKELYLKHYGKHYGWTILNKIIVDAEIAGQIITEFNNSKQEE